ncbi:discoidin domain-containing protein [Streptosporangium sp. NPDC005286]|uniref:discoidin domain-containing protein n=1 Tax=Streptosporangium sp. NPDC005286 TaxID=3154463 RepID=UPI0033BC165E
MRTASFSPSRRSPSSWPGSWSPPAAPKPPRPCCRRAGPASSSSKEGSSYSSGKAVDGNLTSTRWASLEGSDPQWIRVDLGVISSISRVKLFWEAAYGKAYTIQVSDDAANWTTVYSTSSGDGGQDDLGLFYHALPGGRPPPLPPS